MSKKKQFFIGLLICLSMWSGAYYIFQNHFFPTKVKIIGQSMFPTLGNEQGVWIDVVYKKIDRNDIVVFSNPLQPTKSLIKRVVGIPGDRINITANDIFVNGEYLDERYLTSLYTYRPISFIVPKGHLFVMGDNRNYSLDSRHFGFVDIDTVYGYVFWR